MADKRLEDLVNRLEAAVAKLEAGGARGGAGGAGAGAGGDNLAHFAEFTKELDRFSSLGKALGPEIDEMTQAVVATHKGALALVASAGNAPKPAADGLKVLQTKVLEQFTKALNKYNNHKTYGPHMKCLQDTTNSALWCFTDQPDATVKAFIESGEYHALKIKNQKIKEQTEWIDSYFKALNNLRPIVKEHHVTGVIWNPKGTTTVDAISHNIEKAATGKAGSAPTTTAAPTPAPSAKPEEKKEAPKPATTAAAAPKAPSKNLRGKVWYLENYTDDKALKLEEKDVAIHECVYIEKCNGCVITCKAKCKSITLANCQKTTIVFDRLVSGLEIVNCKSVTVYCLEGVPGITIDKTEGCSVYLNKEKEMDIISSKSSEINISFLKPDGEYAKDTPVTPQLVTRWDATHNKFVTKPYEMFM